MHSGRLGWILARSWQVRVSALIVALTACALIVVFGIARYLDTPSAIVAATTVGDAESALNLPYSWTASGADVSSTSNSIIQALAKEGIREARIGYVGGSMTVQNTDVWVEEHDWASEPFPARFSSITGSLPSDPGEIAVSASVAQKSPIGSSVSIFGGAYTAKVVGTFRDEAARHAALVMLSHGTLEELRSHKSGQLNSYNISFSPVLYWSGGGPQDVADIVSSQINAVTEESISVDRLMASIVSSAALKAQPNKSLAELDIALVLAPLAAALVSGWLSGRFLRRIRQTLFSIGVHRTVIVGIGTVSLVAVISSLIGSAFGALVTLAARPIIDSIAPTALGGLEGILGATLLGAACTLITTVLALMLVAPAGQRAKRENRTYSVAIPGAIGGILAVTGIALSLQPDLNLKIIGTICIGLVGVILLPLLLMLFRNIGGPPIVALALRRIGQGGAATAGVVTALAASLLIGVTMMTLYYSDSSSFDATQVARVPPGQAFFESRNDEGALRTRVTDYLDAAAPAPMGYTGGSVTTGNGATLAVNSVSDLERILDRALTVPEQEILSAGGTLRTHTPSSPQVQYENADGQLVALKSMLLIDIPLSYERIDGFILDSTVKSLGATIVRTVFVYTDLSSDQVKLAAEAPNLLGFDSEWLEVHEDPNPYTQPFTLTLFAASTILLGVGVVGAYAAASARALRPRVAALLAVGLPAKWLSTARLLEVMSVTVAALIVALASGMTAASLSIGFGVFPFKFHVPLTATVATVLGVLILTVVITLASSRRLATIERFD